MGFPMMLFEATSTSDGNCQRHFTKFDLLLTEQKGHFLNE